MKRALFPAVSEKLVRLRTTRRGIIVDLRVHYEVKRENGRDTYKIIAVDETG
jgi:hypothetical protein